MKRTYKKKSNLINKTGYTPGYDTENNPVNYIPSENITMANTPYPIYATPLDENGNPINNSIVMKPGGEYKFPGASYVAETPMFKDGGKSDWISAKISTLVKEGYPQKQAVAIAYSMYEDAKKEQGGYQLPMYQTAGTYNFGSGLPKPKFSADPNIATPEQFSEQMNKITEVNPGKYGLGKDPNYVSPLSEESLTAGQDFKKRTDEIGKAAGLPQNFSANIFGETNTESTTKKTELAPPDIKDGQPYQFFNPYSGFDIPTAASTLGSSIESGDTLGTVASGLKLATGLARNFFGGMGQERRKNYVQKEFYDKQREGMTGAGREEMLESGGYYQEGGMEQTGSDVQSQVVQALQQGASPEEIMEQLIQMGMPEEQAIGLIQSIMQQMQPSTPQLRRGGMMYYQDGGEQQIAQQVAQAMQQGMQPQEAMSMLVESGMSEDQAIQLIQAIMGQIQQQGETSQNEEMSQGTPQLRKGGEMIRRADGSYSKRGLWDNIRDNAGSGKKPTKEMLEQEAKIKREYQEGGMEPNMEQQAQGDPTEAIMQQIAQMLEQGADPQQVMQMLVEAGVPEEQAIQMVEAVMQQSQDMPEMRDGGIPERYKNMGFTKVGAKKQSTRPGKKWMVLAKKGDQYKVVHGGDDSMKDFSQHGSESRKENFWNRMGGRDSAKANDPFSPLYWHKKFGTWQDGGEMMDEEMEGENEYMENESVMLEQVEDQVEQALKQGADPQQILEQLIQMGIPQETAQQMIEEILQEIAEGETEMEEGTPQMSKGGKYMRALQGKTIKDYKYNPETNSYTVSYE